MSRTTAGFLNSPLEESRLCRETFPPISMLPLGREAAAFAGPFTSADIVSPQPMTNPRTPEGAERTALINPTPTCDFGFSRFVAL
jgi:hypothetical protein